MTSQVFLIYDQEAVKVKMEIRKERRDCCEGYRASCEKVMSHREKAMAPHSSTLAGKSHGWRSLVGCSPWGREESDTTERLHFQFSLFTFMHWRRKWQPIPVFLPGESQGPGSLVGCRRWGCTESDTTEAT